MRKMDYEMTETELLEKLSEIEHIRWSNWQTWCHKILRENCPSPELENTLERWDKQIKTEYKNLSESEKESDRREVLKYLHFIKKFYENKYNK